MEKGIDTERIVFIFKGADTRPADNISAVYRALNEEYFSVYVRNYYSSKLLDSFVFEDMKKYMRSNTRKGFDISSRFLMPVYNDKADMAGTTGNYFFQDLWGAKRIIANGVKEHYDIGSRVDGFIAHLLAAGINVKMIDIRPFPGEVENLTTVLDDATLLNNIEDESLMSVSALCSLEHFGMGRYGDPIDPEGCFKCFRQLCRKLAKGGDLYISVPVGMERIEFNAHRVYKAETVVNCFSELELAEFSCTHDGTIEYNVDLHKYDDEVPVKAPPPHTYLKFGLFHFRKP